MTRSRKKQGLWSLILTVLTGWWHLCSGIYLECQWWTPMYNLTLGAVLKASRRF